MADSNLQIKTKPTPSPVAVAKSTIRSQLMDALSLLRHNQKDLAGVLSFCLHEELTMPWSKKPRPEIIALLRDTNLVLLDYGSVFRYFNPELQEFYVLILHKAGIGPGFLQPGVTELPELFTSHPDHYALFTTLNGSGLVAWLNKLHERAKVIQRALEELCKTLQEQSKKPIDTWHELFKGTPKKRISYQLTEVMRRYDDLAIATHMTVLVLEHWPLGRQ